MTTAVTVQTGVAPVAILIIETSEPGGRGDEVGRTEQEVGPYATALFHIWQTRMLVARVLPAPAANENSPVEIPEGQFGRSCAITVSATSHAAEVTHVERGDDNAPATVTTVAVLPNTGITTLAYASVFVAVQEMAEDAVEEAAE